MGLKEWAEKKTRKSDLGRAIEEMSFQSGIAGFLSSAIPSISEGDLLDYVATIREGIRESEAPLWGFKGKTSDWTDSADMIRKGKLTLTSQGTKERKAQLGVAVILELARGRVDELLSSASRGENDIEQTRAAATEALESLRERLGAELAQLEASALAERIFSQRDLEQIRGRAIQRVGKLVPR